MGAEFEISSPESNDSGIHSEDRLNRLDSNHGTTSSNTQTSSLKTSAENSLYSSVISSKKSNDKLSRETSAYSRLDEFGEVLQLASNESVSTEAKLDQPEQTILQTDGDSPGGLLSFKHLEQHELPLGWVRCCG